MGSDPSATLQFRLDIIFLKYYKLEFIYFKSFKVTAFITMEGKANLGFDSTERRPSQPGGFLEVDTSDVNAHTYVYQPELSLRRMTIEALPSEEGYLQNIKDMHEYRPNLDELM